MLYDLSACPNQPHIRGVIARVEQAPSISSYTELIDSASDCLHVDHRVSARGWKASLVEAQAFLALSQTSGDGRYAQIAYRMAMLIFLKGPQDDRTHTIAQSILRDSIPLWSR